MDSAAVEALELCAWQRALLRARPAEGGVAATPPDRVPRDLLTERMLVELPVSCNPRVAVRDAVKLAAQNAWKRCQNPEPSDGQQPAVVHVHWPRLLAAYGVRADRRLREICQAFLHAAGRTAGNEPQVGGEEDDAKEAQRKESSTPEVWVLHIMDVDVLCPAPGRDGGGSLSLGDTDHGALLELLQLVDTLAQTEGPPVMIVGSVVGCGSAAAVHPVLRACFEEVFLLAPSIAGDSVLADLHAVASGITLQDVFVSDQVINAVQAAVLWPHRAPELFAYAAVTPATGILLHGAPGTGKTVLAQALASEGGRAFFPLRISDVMWGYVGQSEKAIQDAVTAAMEQAPALLFLDEVQAMFGLRDEMGSMGRLMLSTLFQALDDVAVWNEAACAEWIHASSTNRGLGGPKLVTIVAATNEPWSLDPALLRAGRLEVVVHVDLPSLRQRTRIIARAVRQNDGQKKDDHAHQIAEWLAPRTSGMSGADLELLCQQAAANALDDDSLADGTVAPTQEHYSEALQTVRPSTSALDHERFAVWHQRREQGAPAWTALSWTGSEPQQHKVKTEQQP